MENNNEFDEIIIKCLTGVADPTEVQQVENWIFSSEENRRHFVELKDTWQITGTKRVLDDVLEKLDMDEKWNRFRQHTIQDTAKIIPLQAREEALKHEKPAIKRWFIGTAIAASALLAIVLGWSAIFQTKQVASLTLTKERTPDSVSASNGLLHEVNNSGAAKTIQLPDGSVVLLADQSGIYYRKVFTETRNIILEGKAFFKVAKDKTRPFTVISNDISTTALGTEFTVANLQKDKKIIVRLYEGKVVIKPVNIANKLMKKEVYLLPGEQFVYGQGAVAKTTFKLRKGVAGEEILNGEKRSDDPVLPQNTEGSWYMFNNQSLGEVLDDLSAFYDVKIEYNKRDVQNIYFTGKYNKTESLNTILKRIGTLNNLTITKNDTAFFITK